MLQTAEGMGVTLQHFIFPKSIGITGMIAFWLAHRWHCPEY